MNIQDLQAEIIAIDQEAAHLESGVEQNIVKKLLNIIERLAGENDTLKSNLQNLSDEINRLKGEQGKPDIKANKKKDGNISSETEHKEAEANANKDNGESGDRSEGKKKRQREPKLPKIKIDREQICPLDKAGLPDDLVFKYYEDVVVQDLIIITNNVNYRREVCYSPSQHKTYRGELPTDVRGKGEYGPGIRTLIPLLKAEGNMSEKRILGFFRNFGIEISPAYISQQWTGGYERFHQEKSDLYRSGITASGSVQIDDTSARVNGSNQYCQIVCSPLFTAYFTTPKQDRLTVLSVLTDFMPTRYLYNEPAKRLLDTFKLADKARVAIAAQLPFDVVMDESEFNAHLKCLDSLGIRQSVHLTEACAIVFYQQQSDVPIIERLLADDAVFV